MSGVYYYASDGDQLGPHSTEEMCGFFQQGLISENTFVWTDGMSTWMSISESPLSDILADMLPPPEPPKNPPSVKRTHSVQFSQEAVNARKSVRRASAKNRDSVRTMSQRLLRAPVMDGDKLVWVEDEKKIWLLCSIVEQDNTILKVQDISTQECHIVDTGFKEVQESNDKVVPDMASLHYLHEPGLLYNLQQRFASQHPYTFMGLILIAVNPLEWLPQPTVEDFAGKSLNPDLPHPFAIAESCYQELSLSNAVNQSVVISGESGSGKTETAKMVLRYLVSRLDSGGVDSGSTDSTSIDSRLIQSSPVLEAFGNSCTLRNPNSSRFGKFMKINIYQNKGPAEFQRSGAMPAKIVGATVETYLLEKSRVISQSEGEQNFHIFYQLLAGSEHGFDNIGSSSDYRILNDVVSSDTSSIQEHFVATKYALGTVGYDSNLQSQVWRILFGIMALGNIEFTEVDSAEGGIANIAPNGACQKASECLGITVSQLEDILTRKVMKARGEEFTISLTVNDACFARDAVCKTIYNSLFADIVKSVNSSLQSSAAAPDDGSNSELKYIGVLDIFGFESFAINRFDQLLINYANESLQNTFNVQVFKSELNLLVEENIECALDPSMCPDNSGCVETIWISSSQLRAGECSVLTILDAVSRQPKPLDDKFCSQLHSELGKVSHKQKYFPAPHPKDKRVSFLVKHFAGVVKYSVGTEEESWVAKNNDSSPDALGPILTQSEFLLVGRLLSSCSDIPASDTGRRGQINKSTIASSFAKSMSSLNSELHSTRCAFIRCIKPNAAMTPGVFDNAYAVEQMRALGLVQACEVMRVGLPNRMTYLDLKAALAPIVSEVESLCAGESEEVLVSSLLHACEVDDDSYRLGRTRVFFKPGKLAELESSIQRAVSEERKHEMLQRLKSALSSRRELQVALKNVKDGVAGIEAEVASAWTELDSLQQIVSGGSRDDGSTALAIVCSEASSAVEYLGSLVDSARDKVNTTTSTLSNIDKSSDYDSVRSMLEDIETEMSSVEGIYRSVKMKHGTLSTQGLGKKSEMHDAALDRWQEMSRVDDTLKAVRLEVRRMEAATTKFQASKVQACKEEISSLMQSARSGVSATLVLVRENMSQLGNTSTESTRLTAIANGLIADCRAPSNACETISESCGAVKQEYERLQISLAKHEEERREKEREAREREESEKRLQQEKEDKEEEEKKASANRRGSMKALNVAALRKNIANMSVDRAISHVVEDVPPAPEAPPPVDEWVLPGGWEEFFDATNELPYYFNTLTQETQWERPEAPAGSVGGQIHTVEQTIFEDQKSSSGQAASSHPDEILPTYPAAAAISPNKPSKPLKPNPVASKCSLTYGRITTAQLETLGVEVKKGILMKKSSGGLSRFKKKYFVLEGSVLTYYEKAEQYLCGSGGGKEMRLSIASSTSYTDAENTFIVKSPQLAKYSSDRTNKDLSWLLVAENSSSMHEWVAYINAHINAIHRRVHAEDEGQSNVDGYWSMGEVSTSFWQLPVRNAYGPIKNPVGIRTIPDAQGPRTGEGIFPGEVVEVVQTVEMKGNTYLRLADDRGWIFHTHPTNLTELMARLSEDQYCYVEKATKYRVDKSLRRGVPIHFSPGEGSPATGKSLRHSEEVECSASWQMVNTVDGPGSNTEVFVKLTDGRGWVMAVDVNGATLLEPLVVNPLATE